MPDAASCATESERLLRRAACNCRRKLRHVDFLSALRARRLQDQYLSIYPCSICLGLDVGHRQGDEARRRRSIINELASLDQSIRELEQRRAGLLNRLSAELESMDPADLC
jgi:hypothetical protein